MGDGLVAIHEELKEELLTVSDTTVSKNYLNSVGIVMPQELVSHTVVFTPDPVATITFNSLEELDQNGWSVTSGSFSAATGHSTSIFLTIT